LGNKGLVRELLARKFPQYTVSYKVIKNSVLAIPGEVEKQVQGLFPQEDVERRYIAKPVNGSHSSFVSTINKSEELRDYLRFASNSITEDVIIEEFITGQQYSLDTYVSKSGEVIHTPICQQVIKENVTLYSGYPSQLPAAVEIQLQQVFTEIYRAMGLQTLAVHAEFRYSPEMGLRIIELNPRTGGYRSDMLNLSYGIDHIKNYVNIFSGQEIIVSGKLQKYSMCPQFWSEDTGVLVEITGLENLSELSSYSTHYVLQKVGRVVGPAAAGYQRCLTVILANDSEQVLLGDLEKLQALIKIKVV
jgi:predicted ATP-grasp superfamily ATP-dependent carboligase